MKSAREGLLLLVRARQTVKCSVKYLRGVWFEEIYINRFGVHGAFELLVTEERPIEKLVDLYGALVFTPLNLNWMFFRAGDAAEEYVNMDSAAFKQAFDDYVATHFAQDVPFADEFSGNAEAMALINGRIETQCGDRR